MSDRWYGIHSLGSDKIFVTYKEVSSSLFYITPHVPACDDQSECPIEGTKLFNYSCFSIVCLLVLSSVYILQDISLLFKKTNLSTNLCFLLLYISRSFSLFSVDLYRRQTMQNTSVKMNGNSVPVMTMSLL